MPLKTLAEVGFKVKGMDDWFHGGNFGLGIRDTVNLTAIHTALVRKWGENAVQLVKGNDKQTGKLKEVCMLIPPIPEIARDAEAMLRRAAEGEILSDELFWAVVTPILQQMWEGASLYERIRLTNEADAHASAVMKEIVPPEVATIIYRGIDLDADEF